MKTKNKLPGFYRKIGAGREAVQRRVIELAGNLEYSVGDALRSARQNRATAGFLTGRTLAGLPLSESVVQFYDGLMAGLKDAKVQEERI